jgi:hypothetical protein
VPDKSIEGEKMTTATNLSRSFWVPLATGILFVSIGETGGFFDFAFALPPALACIAAAFTALSGTENKRAHNLAALAGVLGMVFGVLGLFLYGFVEGLMLTGLSAWTFVDAGASAAKTIEPVEGVPAPETGASFAAKVALDEALLSMISYISSFPGKDDIARIDTEVRAAEELFEARGWLEKPQEYHRAPLSLEVPQIQTGTVRTMAGRLDFEALSFESEYEPHPEEPGRDRWLGYIPNRTAHAHVLRHPGEPRPWIVCIHGYQMGSPLQDFGAFDPQVLHQKMGFNMVLPTLPLHGKRKIGRISGDGFLRGDMLDTIHAESQALWDIRRLISWVRTQDAPTIGVYGLSLGGYTTSNLVSVEPGLDFAISGIPLTDIAGSFWTHMPDAIVRQFLEAGITPERLARITQVVSPLHMQPKVARENRAIFGGVGDRLVSPRQVRDLIRHWEEPANTWYQGSHITFMAAPEVKALIASTLRRATAANS